MIFMIDVYLHVDLDGAVNGPRSTLDVGLSVKVFVFLADFKAFLERKYIALKSHNDFVWP